ncbi:1767_t:CDS:2 [Diversispora eburnea]|uniref:1767_t:CDS:1 n=1 Tax=Diversispora eburnea TaxID=1213867 RepID=A0A9N8YMD4_9GLOM|nr:1767_t:CDS:2 [Diversispora eburnea]
MSEVLDENKESTSRDINPSEEKTLQFKIDKKNHELNKYRNNDSNQESVTYDLEAGGSNYNNYDKFQNDLEFVTSETRSVEEISLPWKHQGPWYKDITKRTYAMSRVFIFEPVFRAEGSLTSEFRMLEAEIAYLFELEELLNFTEKKQQNIFWIITHKIYHLYSEAIDVLSKAKANQKFEFLPKYDSSLHSEHEKYLANNYCYEPVFITDYPKEIKPFYMRINPDDKQNNDLNLRKYGTATAPHGEFGIGFERYLPV